MGLSYVLEVPADTRVWLEDPGWIPPPKSGRGSRSSGKFDPLSLQELGQKARALPKAAWEEISVAEGAQGPRTYQYARERVRESHDDPPCGIVWAVYRENLDGTEPRYFLSEAPDAPLVTLAKVSAYRWPIETEIQTNKSHVGLDHSKVRSYSGWRRHLTRGWRARFSA